MEVLVLLALFCTSISGEWPVPGIVKNLAGSYGTKGFVNGAGTNAQFNMPRGMALDPTTGNLYVSDYVNHAVRVINPYGNVSTLGNTFSSNDNPYGLAFNEADRVLYVGMQSSNGNSGFILRIDVDNLATSVMLQSGTPVTDDPAHPIKNPQAILYDNTEQILYFSEYTSALRAWPYPFESPTTIQTLYVAASGGSWSFVRDSSYNSYMGVQNQLIKIPPVGPSRIVAGNYNGGYLDGPNPQFRAVEGLAWSADKDFIYVADNGNGVIRKVLLDAVTTTVAGIAGTNSFIPGSTTTPGSGATFYHASDIYAHPYAINFYYIADQSGIRVWYGAPPNITNLSIAPNYVVQNGIILDATVLVPYCTVTEFIVILEAAGFAHETHSTPTLPYAVVPQHLKVAYTISVFASNEYGTSDELTSKYHS